MPDFALIEFHSCYLILILTQVIYWAWSAKISSTGLYILKAYLNYYMQSKDLRYLDYPEVTISMRIESSFNMTLLRNIANISVQL